MCQVIGLRSIIRLEDESFLSGPILTAKGIVSLASRLAGTMGAGGALGGATVGDYGSGGAGKDYFTASTLLWLFQSPTESVAVQVECLEALRAVHQDRVGKSARMLQALELEQATALLTLQVDR